MHINRLDHLVLTVADVHETCKFYSTVLGMDVVTFGTGRKALSFGSQKINLHQFGNEFEPKAGCPQPGSADLCFITTIAIDAVISHLQNCNVHLLEGPVMRTGATGPFKSVYFRDPDGNLVEVSNYADS